MNKARVVRWMGFLVVILVAAILVGGCKQGGGAAVAVSGDVAIYVTQDGSLYAVDAKSGSQKWTFSSKSPVNSVPTVSGGMVYFSTADGKLHALSVATGSESWAFASKKETRSSAPVAKGPAPKQTVSERAKVEFYVMSKCPFGVQVESGIIPVLKKMGGDMDFSLDFIGGVSGDTLTSLHKEPEVEGDKVQLCAAKYAPNSYMDLIDCMNKNMQAIPGNWEDCAEKTSVPIDRVRECYKGQEGFELAKASFERSRSRRASGSPTIYIGGKLYNGGRTEQSFTRAVCDAFPKDKPKLCADLPPPVKVPMIIVSDARCKDCKTEMIKSQMEGFFPGSEIKSLDYADAEGKKLYQDLKLGKLPVILFGQEVKKAENFARLERSLEPKGDYLGFGRYGTFDPTKEICDNKADDTGDGKVDCDDPDCKNALECRPEMANKLEVFVMSQCPYGVKALNAVKEVLDNFKGKVNFGVHFIGDEQGGKLTSMHGQGEVDENIRQLCAIKHYGKNYKFMDYILCRNKDYRSGNWEGCATGGIDAKRIKDCFEKEGTQLMRDDIKVAQGLGVQGSPTWFANNKFRFSGLDAESVKNNLCKYNKDLAGCDKKLSGPEAQGAVPAGSCGQ